MYFDLRGKGGSQKTSVTKCSLKTGPLTYL